MVEVRGKDEDVKPHLTVEHASWTACKKILFKWRAYETCTPIRFQCKNSLDAFTDLMSIPYTKSAQWYVESESLRQFPLNLKTGDKIQCRLRFGCTNSIWSE